MSDCDHVPCSSVSLNYMSACMFRNARTVTFLVGGRGHWGSVFTCTVLPKQDTPLPAEGELTTLAEWGKKKSPQNTHSKNKSHKMCINLFVCRRTRTYLVAVWWLWRRRTWTWVRLYVSLCLCQRSCRPISSSLWVVQLLTVASVSYTKWCKSDMLLQ